LARSPGPFQICRNAPASWSGSTDTKVQKSWNSDVRCNIIRTDDAILDDPGTFERATPRTHAARRIVRVKKGKHEKASKDGDTDHGTNLNAETADDGGKEDKE